MEMIARLTRKAAPLAVTKPKGLYCASTGTQPITDNRPKDRKRGLGVMLHGSWGLINRPTERVWIRTPDATAKPGVKTGHRHGPHALTKIAEKWRK